METIVGLIILIIAPAIFAQVIQGLFYKEKNRVESFLAYVCYMYIVIASLKTVLGEGSISLIESFEENSVRTYLHYSLPMLALVIICPSLLHFLKIKFTYISCIVEHRVIAILFILSSFNVMQHWKVQNMVVLLWAVLMIVYIPNKIYLTNVREFHVSYSSYAFSLLGGAAIVSLAIIISSLLILNPKEVRVYISCIFAYSVACYIQQNFLNGKMAQLDGKGQTWSSSQMGINIIVWLIIISVLIILGINKPKASKIYAIAAGYISLILVFTTTYMIFTTDFSKDNNSISTRKMLELDDSNNIIVFVLVWYDEQVLQQIVDDDPGFLEPLDGFTWYRNQAERYTFTYMSLPYLLTGVQWDTAMTEDEYTDYAFDNSSFLKSIYDKGYDIGIYTIPQVVRDNAEIIENYSSGSTGKSRFWPTVIMMSSCSKYEAMPFCIKNSYWSTSGDVDEMRYDGDDYDGDNVWFYNKLLDKKIQVSRDNSKGSYRLYHLWGIHDSNLTDDMQIGAVDLKTCGRNVFRIVYEYIKQLKECGLYENSTIIILADHGQNYLGDDTRYKDKGLNKTSSSILLVKKAGDTQGLTISDIAVSHDNFFATVLNSIGNNNGAYEKAYDEVTELDYPVRYTEYYRSGDIPYIKYQIDGLVTDEDSWSLAH